MLIQSAISAKETVNSVQHRVVSQAHCHFGQINYSQKITPKFASCCNPFSWIGQFFRWIGSLFTFKKSEPISRGPVVDLFKEPVVDRSHVFEELKNPINRRYLGRDGLTPDRLVVTRTRPLTVDISKLSDSERKQILEWVFGDIKQELTSRFAGKQTISGETFARAMHQFLGTSKEQVWLRNAPEQLSEIEWCLQHHGKSLFSKDGGQFQETLNHFNQLSGLKEMKFFDIDYHSTVDPIIKPIVLSEKNKQNQLTKADALKLAYIRLMNELNPIGEAGYKNDFICSPLN